MKIRSNNKLFRLVQPASRYGSYYPTVTDKLAEQGVNLMIAVCCVADDKGGLTGEFNTKRHKEPICRACYNSETSAS